MARLDMTEIHPQISFDYCIKCTICNTVCPVTPVFPDFPGPKYCGPDSERFRIQFRYNLEYVAQYCINCKRCETICPSDVKITHFIEQDKFRQKKNIVKKLRSLFFIYMDIIGSIATRFSWIVNTMMKIVFIRQIMQIVLGIAAKRKLPTYSSSSFVRYFKKYNKQLLKEKNGISETTQSAIQNPPTQKPMEIYFFHGCFVNYNDLNLGKDFLEFCRRHSIKVNLFPQKCCGIPIASAGDADAYQKRVMDNFQSFWPIIQKGGKIVSISSSCSMAIRKDYLRHIPLDDKEIFQNGIYYFNNFLHYMAAQGMRLQIEKKYKQIVYHVPCHVKYAGETANTVALLNQLTDDLIIFDENCCGIGGSYGVKKEFYEIAEQVGQLLFQKLNTHTDAVWTSDCETCRMQIEENTAHPIFHPISLLIGRA